MKKTIYLLLLLIVSLTAIAQETPPAILKTVNAQLYIHLPDSAIWHYKGRAPNGTDYGWERLGRYKDINHILDSLNNYYTKSYIDTGVLKHYNPRFTGNMASTTFTSIDSVWLNLSPIFVQRSVNSFITSESNTGFNGFTAIDRTQGIDSRAVMFSYRGGGASFLPYNDDGTISLDGSLLDISRITKRADFHGEVYKKGHQVATTDSVIKNNGTSNLLSDAIIYGGNKQLVIATDDGANKINNSVFSTTGTSLSTSDVSVNDQASLAIIPGTAALQGVRAGVNNTLTIGSEITLSKTGQPAFKFKDAGVLARGSSDEPVVWQGDLSSYLPVLSLTKTLTSKVNPLDVTFSTIPYVKKRYQQLMVDALKIQYLTKPSDFIDTTRFLITNTGSSGMTKAYYKGGIKLSTAGSGTSLVQLKQYPKAGAWIMEITLDSTSVSGGTFCNFIYGLSKTGSPLNFIGSNQGGNILGTDNKTYAILGGTSHTQTNVQAQPTIVNGVPYKVYLMSNGVFVTSLVIDQNNNYTWGTTFALSTFIDNTQASFFNGDWRFAMGISTDATTASVQIKGIKTSYWGGTSFGDQSPVNNEDGSPLIKDNTAFFTASLKGFGNNGASTAWNNAYTGVFAIDLTTKDIIQTGMIIRKSGTKIVNDFNDYLMYDRTVHKFRLFHPNFGDSTTMSDARLVKTQYKLIDEDMLQGVHIIDSMKTLDPSNNGNGNIDPMAVYQNGHLYFAYTEQNNTGNQQLCFSKTDNIDAATVTWTPIFRQDTTQIANPTYQQEGSKIWLMNGKKYFATTTRVGKYYIYEIADVITGAIGNINAPFTSNPGGHPALIPIQENGKTGYIHITTDGQQGYPLGNVANYAVGNTYVYGVNQQETGYEFPLTNSERGAPIIPNADVPIPFNPNLQNVVSKSPNLTSNIVLKPGGGILGSQGANGYSLVTADTNTQAVGMVAGTSGSDGGYILAYGKNFSNTQTSQPGSVEVYANRTGASTLNGGVRLGGYDGTNYMNSLFINKDGNTVITNLVATSLSAPNAQLEVRNATATGNILRLTDNGGTQRLNVTNGGLFSITASNTEHSIKSGSSSGYAGLIFGRTGTDGELAISGSSGQFTANAGAGDMTIRHNSTLFFIDGSNNERFRQLSSGLTSWGGITPTAWVTLPAGTATASTSPLKFTTGVTQQTSLEQGAVNWDGTNLHIGSTGSPIDQTFAYLASPALTGTPTAPTAAAGTNTTQVATAAHVFAERTNTATLMGKTIAVASNSITSTAGRAAQFNVSTGNLEASTVTTTELALLSGKTTLASVSDIPVKGHTIFTPTTGGTVNLVNKQNNIINPAGALLALTINLPSSPANDDVVTIKFTQTITTVTYTGGTVVDPISGPAAGGYVVLTYDTATASWY